MTWQVGPLAQVRPTPWRNGGGSTRELLAWPSAADWQVRISVAEVESDGPFSSFPGIERWFAVLEGAGVELVVGGTPHRLAPGSAPLRFDGAAPAHCTLLAGATRDLNLMAPPGRARMQRVAGRQRLAWSGGGLLALYATRPAILDDVQLPAASLAWRLADAAGAAALDCESAFWMEVSS